MEGLMALDRFAYKVDLLYQTIGLTHRVVESPIGFQARTRERTKFNFREIIATFMVVLRLKICNFKTVSSLGKKPIPSPPCNTDEGGKRRR